jgi:hypothetical protein
LCEREANATNTHYGRTSAHRRPPSQPLCPLQPTIKRPSPSPSPSRGHPRGKHLFFQKGEKGEQQRQRTARTTHPHVRACALSMSSWGRGGCNRGTRAMCRSEGCTVRPANAGLCKKHGAYGACLTVGCATMAATKSGQCVKHGARGQCTVEGCDANVNVRGLCMKHGGDTRSACTHPGCTTPSKARGLCWSHGGGTKKGGAAKGVCSHAGCTTPVQQRGLCVKHGAHGVYGARFRREFTLEDAIGSHTSSIEASMCATVGIPVGCSLLFLPVGTVNCVQILKVQSKRLLHQRGERVSWTLPETRWWDPDSVRASKLHHPRPTGCG